MAVAGLAPEPKFQLYVVPMPEAPVKVRVEATFCTGEVGFTVKVAEGAEFTTTKAVSVGMLVQAVED